MKVKQIFLLTFSAILLLNYGCSEKEQCCDVIPAPDKYEKGVFIVNEGPFGGSGTISWYNPASGEVQDSLFEKANNGASLGQFVQSLVFHNNQAFIVVNGANRVVVAEANTFKYIDTIGGLSMPRFFLPLDNQTAYVSQWGSDGLTGSVAKVDLITHKVLKTIPTGHGPEKMVRVGSKVYVANSGGYGLDSTITEIDLATDSPQTLSLPAGRNPACLAWSDFSTPGELFYLCKGYFMDSTPAGRLNYQSNSGFGAETPAFADDLVYDSSNGNLYFIGANTLYQVKQGGTDFSFVSILQRSMYGLGFDQENQLLYCTDAKDFTGNGEVFIHRTDGNYVNFFRCGVAPGEVVIRK